MLIEQAKDTHMTLNRSLHTQTHRTAPRTPHPPPPHPTAPPRWERDEEMEQPEGGAEQNTYGRLKSCTTLPGVSHFPGQPRPFEAGK